jgi:hypothetical protein
VRWTRALLRAGCLLGLILLAGCGGGDGGGIFDSGGGNEKAAGLTGSKSESPDKFAKNFEGLTGVTLKQFPGELFGIRLQAAGEPDRFLRYGVYSLVWTTNDEKRDKLLGKEPAESDGIHWKKTGSSYTASKPYGSRLVLRWVGRGQKQVTPQFERLSRVLDAAVAGKSSSLPEEERPCPAVGLDPFKGKTGQCSVKGIPTTFVDAGQTLKTPVVEARVLGMQDTGEFRFKGLAPITANGHFTVVAYEVTNKSSFPLRYLHPQLQFPSKVVPENPDTTFLLPRSRDLPLPPGEKIVVRTAFDVPESDNARDAAFVLPAQRDGTKDPTNELAQGWIRLKEAASRLPKAPKDSSVPEPAP